MWIYGSGFPKAQDLGKMIDKRNGRKVEDFKQLGKYLKEQRLERGLNTNDIGKKFPSRSGGITGCYRNWEYGNNVPTIEQWGVLKKLLNLNGKFDWLIEREEAEREKIGINPNINKGKAGWQNTGYVGGKVIDGDDSITTPSTDLAKHWDGFKVGGIKPAYEPIIWAVKPPEGSYVDNVLKWGVGAVNVDECRIGIESTRINRKNKSAELGYHGKGSQPNITGSPKGRFPANIILSHHHECMQMGMKRVKTAWSDKGHSKTSIFNNAGEHIQNKPVDSDGCEIVESWDCHPDCAVRILDEQSGDCKTGAVKPYKEKHINASSYQFHRDKIYIKVSDSGGASRFFYCAKASRGERNAGLEGMEKKKKHTSSGDDHVMNEICPYHHITLCKCGWRSKAVSNHHPTVKPIKLFEYLIKLVTREGQIILDPFIGSGTTTIAAHNIGRKCVGIEKEGEYLEIAKRRIDYWQKQPKQLALGG